MAQEIWMMFWYFACDFEVQVFRKEESAYSTIIRTMRARLNRVPEALRPEIANLLNVPDVHKDLEAYPRLCALWKDAVDESFEVEARFFVDPEEVEQDINPVMFRVLH